MAIKHKIRKGDTQKKYEEAFGVSWDKIKKKNPDVKRLTPDNFILLPILKEAYDNGCDILYNNKTIDTKKIIEENVEEIVQNALISEDKFEMNISSKVEEQSENEPITSIKKLYQVVTSSTIAKLNIRKEPDLNAPIVGTLFYGEEVEGYECDGWIKIENGYILLSKTKEIE